MAKGQDSKNPYFAVGYNQYAIVYEKFGISMDKQLQMDTLSYNKVLRDAICLKYAETQKGRDYLFDCWRLQQTEPDLGKITKTEGRIWQIQGL